MPSFKVFKRDGSLKKASDGVDSFKTLVEKEKANLSWADLSGANLSWADLSGADLSGADLSGADLSGADLSGADLFRANLSRADLSRANLSEANLSGADLSGADIDYSCIPFKCTSLKAIFDDRIRIQYMYHAVRTDGQVKDPDLANLFKNDLFLKVVNKFHRVKEYGYIGGKNA